MNAIDKYVLLKVYFTLSSRQIYKYMKQFIWNSFRLDENNKRCRIVVKSILISHFWFKKKMLISIAFNVDR